MTEKKRTERSLLDELRAWAEHEEERAHNLGKGDGPQAEYWRGQERAFAIVRDKIKGLMPIEAPAEEPQGIDSSPLPANPSKDVIEDELRKTIVDIWTIWQRCDGFEQANRRLDSWYRELEKRTVALEHRERLRPAMECGPNPPKRWEDHIEERIGDLEEGANTSDAAIARLEELMVGVVEAVRHHRLVDIPWPLGDLFDDLRAVTEHREGASAGTVAAEDVTVSVRVEDEPWLHSASGGVDNEG